MFLVCSRSCTKICVVCWENKGSWIDGSCETVAESLDGDEAFRRQEELNAAATQPVYHVRYRNLGA